MVKEILIELKTFESSGFHDLDDAAVEAFNRAAPFSNPPQGILDDDDTVILRWDFILRSQSSSKLGFVLSQL